MTYTAAKPTTPASLLRKSILTMLMLAAFAFVWPSQQAEARAGYAKWLKHGDYYSVSGSFAGYRGAIRVGVKWRGNRFVVTTPLGTFPLKRAGRGVTFRVYFQKSWAAVTWVHKQASVVYKGKRGIARVKKLRKRKVGSDRNSTLK